MKPFFDHEKLKCYQEALLVGLIRSNSETRLHEEPAPYLASQSGPD